MPLLVTLVALALIVTFGTQPKNEDGGRWLLARAGLRNALVSACVSERRDVKDEQQAKAE